MNQQAKDGFCQMLEKNLENRRTKMKEEDKIMRTTHNLPTKCCFSCEEEEGHLSRDCLKKRKRFPTITLEYEENEVKDLLALEIPKKKKKKIKEKDNSKTLCWNCRELGHYVRECPEPNSKGEQIWSLLRNATKKDTMQGDAKRKALQDFKTWDN
jgi:hypothetical protein